MKQLLPLLLLLVSTSANTQMVYNEGEKWGILFRSGQPALKAEYDRIQQNYAYHCTVFICVKDRQYGLYNLCDSTFTGCKYDSVFLDYQGIVRLKDNGRYGYIGYNEDTGKRTIIEPAYDQIMILSPCAGRQDSSGKIIDHCRGVSVRIDSLWGVVNYEDGSPRLPIKYANDIDLTYDHHFFNSIDRKNGISTLIEPYTLIEFKVNWGATVYERPEWNLLYSVTPDASMDPREAVAWNYETGVETWHYNSNAAHMFITFESASIVHVEEQFITTTGGLTHITVKHSFHNISNGAVLFTYECNRYTFVETIQEDNTLVIYASEPTNRNRKKSARHKIAQLFL